MNELLNVNFDTQTVSARELHEQLHIGTKFTTWFERMKEYGFTEGNEFFPKMGETSESGGRPSVDYDISVDMAKQICMIQRTPEGKQCRQYLLDLEKAWNTPEQVMARALKIANRTIDSLKEHNTKLICQNGCQIGQKRLFEWMRANGYLILRKGSDYNMPTQRSMEMGLFEIKESTHLNGDGLNVISKTPKVTGKGQQYFINKFMKQAEAV